MICVIMSNLESTHMILEQTCFLQSDNRIDQHRYITRPLSSSRDLVEHLVFKYPHVSDTVSRSIGNFEIRHQNHSYVNFEPVSVANESQISIVCKYVS